MLDIYVLVSYLSLEIHSLGHSSVVEFLFSMWKAVVTTQVPLKKYIIETDDYSGKVGRTRFVWKFLLHIVFIYINALEIFLYLNSHLLCGSCIISFVSSLLFSTSFLLLIIVFLFPRVIPEVYLSTVLLYFSLLILHHSSWNSFVSSEFSLCWISLFLFYQ